MLDEIFKDIPGFDGKYQVSNKGCVVSHTLPIWIPHFKKKQIRKSRKNKLIVTLHKNPREAPKKRLISALVLETFGFPRPNKIHIPIHKDNDTANCCLDNLYWGMQKMPWGEKNKKGNCSITIKAKLILLKKFILNNPEVLEKISKRDGNILLFRCGMYKDKFFTLQELGDRYNLTRERIRQIECKSCKKIGFVRD